MNFNPLKWFNKNERGPKTTVENNLEKNREGELERFSKQLMRKARKGVVMFSFMAPFLAMGSSSSGPGSNLKMSKIEKSKSDKEWNIDVTDRFHTRDSSGVEEFNYWAIPAPIQFELERETKFVNNTNLVVPYHWAQFYDNWDAMTPAERDSVGEYMVQEFQKQLAQKISFWGFGNTTEEVYNYQHGVNQTPHSIKSPITVDSITITGLASPEGTGKNSWLPGKIDAKNIKLAEGRAQDLTPFIKEALRRLGINVNVIKTISGEEVQFSPSEVATIFDLANKGGYINGGDSIGGVHLMIRDYNRGALKDSAAVKTLDVLLATKRGVEVEIFYHGKESTKTVIPIPLILLLLPFIRLPKSGDGSGPGGVIDDPLPPPEPVGPRQIFSEATFDKDKMDKGDQNFHDIYRTALEGVSGKDREIIYETVFAEEIYDFMNSREAIDNGLNYRNIIKLSRQLRESGRYKQDDEIKEILAEEVLAQWQNYDRKIRGGIKTTDLKNLVGMKTKDGKETTTIDYRHDPKKVVWAIEAALHLFELGGTKTNEELAELMDQKVDGIEGRRDARGNTKMRMDINRVEKPVPEPVIDGPFIKNGGAPEVKITSSISEAEKKRLEEEAKAAKKVAKKVPAKKVATKKVAAKKVTPKKFVVATPSATTTTPVTGPSTPVTKTPDAPYYMYDKETDEMLHQAWLGDEAPDNLPVEPSGREALQSQINAIDVQLRGLEKELETQLKQFGSPKASTEKKFNELEQQKRAIEKDLAKAK